MPQSCCSYRSIDCPEILRLAAMIEGVHIDTARNAHNMCKMKNLTLRIDGKVLERARRVAMEQGTSVNAVIRDYLESYANTHDRRAEARRQIVEMCRNSKARIGPEGINWRREELYDRR